MKLKNAFLSTLNNICKENYDTRCSKIFYRTKKSWHILHWWNCTETTSFKLLSLSVYLHMFIWYYVFTEEHYTTVTVLMITMCVHTDNTINMYLWDHDWIYTKTVSTSSFRRIGRSSDSLETFSSSVTKQSSQKHKNILHVCKTIQKNKNNIQTYYYALLKWYNINKWWNYQKMALYLIIL